MHYQAKHMIAKVLRKLRLLQFVDSILEIKCLIKNRKVNRDFIDTHSNFPIPPAHLAFDAYNNIHWQSYFNSGVNQATVIANFLNKETVTNDFRILEWGCGPGRIIRHLKCALRNDVKLYGADYNKETIEWNRQNIKGIEFVVNQLEPPLPFESAFFDCVYAISVFTHLSERMHFEWIKEMERIVKPNGLVIITTHGDLTTDRLLPDEKQLYDSGSLVVRDGVKEGKKWYLAYAPPKFIRHNLLEAFEILHSSCFASNQQDLWVARRKEK
jgi:ubiquinone/menaquinone biosynthesis C-methylase UbiE